MVGAGRRVMWIVPVALMGACGARSELYVESPEGTGGTGGAGTTVGCETGTIALVRAEPTVMLVIDKSKSMEDSLPSSPSSKWTVLKDALGVALPQADEAMRIGALLFPAGSSAGGASGPSCDVPGDANLEPDTGHVYALLSLLSGTNPGGATPTAAAVESAAKLLLGTRAATTARALVLATDGAPDCNANIPADECVCVKDDGCNSGGSSTKCLDDERTVDALAGALEAGAPTYVIGIQDGSNAKLHEVLNAMAVAGGKAQEGGVSYYSASSESELVGALGAIRDQVGSCTYLVASVPDDGGSITVTIDGAAVPFDEGGTDGWSWGNKENGEVLFSGAACSLVTTKPDAVVQAEVACAQ